MTMVPLTVRRSVDGANHPTPPEGPRDASRQPGFRPVLGAGGEEGLFAAMVRNAETPMTFFRLPVDRVVEFGTQVEI